MGFLCQAVCPKALIYPTTVHKVPNVSQCYHGLCRHSDTQEIAVSILLHVLDLVGARNPADELQRIANDNHIEKDGADARKVDTLPADAKESLRFRELLFKIYRQLPDDNRLAVISLSSRILHPPRHENYTRCLFVHFLIMMQGKVISPTHMQPLHECLLIIGQMEIIDHINTYCVEKGLPQLPLRSKTHMHGYNRYSYVYIYEMYSLGIGRNDAKKGAAPAPARPAIPKLDCVVDPGPPPPRPNVATAEQTTDSTEIVEKEIFLQSTQGLNLFYMQQLVRCRCTCIHWL